MCSLTHATTYINTFKLTSAQFSEFVGLVKLIDYTEASSTTLIEHTPVKILQ